jgi:hypothetical protein
MHKKFGGNRSVHQQRNSTQLDRWLAPEDLLDGIGHVEFYAQVPSSQSV